MPLLEFHPLAIKETREAYRWYKKQDEDAAARFQKAFDRATLSIESQPGVSAKYLFGTRAVRFKKFPYFIVFQILPMDRLFSLAVAHERRKPGYWRKRLRK